MRPMIRLGNLNARPSCPAAAPGSTVWVYLYAAGHRDMPGDSPAGHRRLSGIKAQSGTRAQDGKIADACVKEKPPPPGNGRRADGMAWGRNLHLHEPDSPEQDTFTGHTPEQSQNRRPENRRRLDLRAAQAMR